MDVDPARTDPQDDTLGGLDGEPGGFRDRHHDQSQSLDQGLVQAPRAQFAPDAAADAEANLRYATPPIPQQQQASISRPPSGLSGNGGYGGDHISRAGGNGNDAASTAGQWQGQQPQNGGGNGRNHVVIKVGMVGDAQIGKTSLMVKYVEGSWDEDYIQTLGVNFMEKTISIRNTEITFSIWDLGGQREFVNMLPLVCNDAVAILFMFDLTRKSTLNSIKEWYRQGRGFNKTAIPILVGTKYDHFVNFPREDQEEISNQVSRSCVQSCG